MLWLIAILLAPPTPTAEVARLERWFTQAAAIVESHAPDLDAERAARRAELLNALADYVDGGLFPANPSRGWAPVFVDADDTRCAMAHLLEVTGDEALMRRVAATQNRAEVVDLIDDPELQAWLDWHGLTGAEAAAIQPAYPGPTQPSCICEDNEYGDVRPPSSVLRLVREGEALRVTEVFGAGERYAVGDTLAIADVRGTPLRGAPPWLAAVFSATVWQLPYSEPCPAITPYPGQPPPPLTHAQMAQAALAGADCPEVLKRIDSRWGYTSEGCGGDVDGSGGGGCGTTTPSGPTGLLILGLLIARRRRSTSRRSGSARRDGR